MGNPQTVASIEEKIVSLYLGGLGAVAVAKRARVGTSTVYRVLLRRGHKIRERGAAQVHLRAIQPKDEKKVVRMHAAGKSLSQIAERLDCEVHAVRKVLIRHNVTPNPRGQVPLHRNREAVAVIVAFYQGGLSQTDIGLLLGHCQTAISSVLKHAGISKRPRRGPWSSCWLGGRIPNPDGYWLVKLQVGDPLLVMANQAGYVLEHRLVMARKLGRPLRSTETVHHINGDHSDNRLENLQLRHNRHGKHIALCCGDCGSVNIIPAKLADPPAVPTHDPQALH